MRYRSWPLCLALLLAFPGCRLDDLAFRQTSGFAVIEPKDHAVVALPVPLRWTAGSTGGSTSALFGVFVDRAPQPPGRTLRHFKKAEPACFPSGGGFRHDCLNAEGIYVTGSTSLLLESVPRRLGAPKGLEDHHAVTIVPLGADSRRRGEAAATVQFRLNRAKQ